MAIGRRPKRHNPEAERLTFTAELERCLECGQPLSSVGSAAHSAKTVQTLEGEYYVVAYSRRCLNPECEHNGKHYHASGHLKVSLPYSTYGLDVVAYVGIQRKRHHRQFIEIEADLNGKGVAIKDKSVGRQYRQFLALLAGAWPQRQARLEKAVGEYDGLVLTVDGLAPDGDGPQLYVMWEALSGTPVSGVLLDKADTPHVTNWMRACQALLAGLSVQATMCDGEDALLAALQAVWPAAKHGLCQSHYLGNLAKPVAEDDRALAKTQREQLMQLPGVPTLTPEEAAERIETLIVSPEATSMKPLAERIETPTPETVTAPLEPSPATPKLVSPAVSPNNSPEPAALRSPETAPLLGERSPTTPPKATALPEAGQVPSIRAANGQGSRFTNGSTTLTTSLLFGQTTPPIRGAPSEDQAPRQPIAAPQLERYYGYYRRAIRDALTRPSRKPFQYGGLQGHDQLLGVNQALRARQARWGPDPYLDKLQRRVQTALTASQAQAESIRQAKDCLVEVERCLAQAHQLPQTSLVPPRSLVVKQELKQIFTDLAHQPDLGSTAQRLLQKAQRMDKDWLPGILHCYDAPHLPRHNLQLESLFGTLRRSERRITGKKETSSLRIFGPGELMFTAVQEDEVLPWLQSVPIETYWEQRRQQEEREEPRRWLKRLRQDPAKALAQADQQFYAVVKEHVRAPPDTS